MRVRLAFGGKASKPSVTHQRRHVGRGLLVVNLAAVALLYALWSRKKADNAQPFVEVEIKNLRLQLAQVDIEIKKLLQAIEEKAIEESDTREKIARAQNRTQKLLANLQNAADAYSDLLHSISIAP